MDNELLRIWQLVHELSEQLAHNQKITSALQSQASALKVSLSDSILTSPRFSLNKNNYLGTGCPLRDWILAAAI
jgi:hypothetical protein